MQPRFRSIAIFNRKGGVGKTHLSWLLSSNCIERGSRCLVVDLDPQANFTNSFLSDPVDRHVGSVFDASQAPKITDLICATEWQSLDLVPSSPALDRFNVSNKEDWLNSELHLSLANALTEIQAEYDYVIFDCPPTLSLVSIAALCAADYLMIPLEAARWGALGTQHVISAMEQVQATDNPKLKLLGYVVSRFKQRRAYQQTYRDELYRQFGDDVFQTVIPDLAAFEKAVTDKIPITLHSPKSHAACIARQFFDEVEERIQRLSQGGENDGGGRLSKNQQTAA